MSGVRKTSARPSLKVAETTRRVRRANRVRQTSDFRMPAGDRVSSEDLINDLAKHLAAAYLAYQMDSSFNLVMRTYVEPQARVGEMWKAAARFILNCQAENSPTPGPQLVGAGQASGGNAA